MFIFFKRNDNCIFLGIIPSFKLMVFSCRQTICFQQHLNELYSVNHHPTLPIGQQPVRDLKGHGMLRSTRRDCNTYSYEDCLFRYVPRLRTLRDLKEMYISFNTRNAGNPVNAAKELDELILHYRSCDDSIFKDFAGTLYRYRNPIITSFVMVEKCGPGGIYDARLSNGPIESLNRKVKDLKRSGRGYRNFEHFRNRFLFSTRNRPVLNGISDSRQVQYFDEEDFD